ncbi:MAG TPA: hypothetical protein GXZ27_13140 [Thermoanaerobacterales bacterium]|jgi:hypothetical protein|nr:hypothetical protein [Thermoanaerobacterales bacterium]
MSETPTTQQFPSRRRFRFLFIFRITPGFFVGFVPRRHGFSSDFNPDFTHDYGHYEDDMAIQHINEQEYMFLRRIGISEIDVMM